MAKQEGQPYYVVATGKSSTVDVVEANYGITASAINPEDVAKAREPLSDSAWTQASWKAAILAQAAREGYIKEGQATILAADTVYLHNGVALHKPGNENGRTPYGETGSLTQEQVEHYIRETEVLFAAGFNARWEVAIIYHVLDKRNRSAILEVSTDFPEGVSPDHIRQNFRPELNTRIPLLEHAIERGQKIVISNSGRGEQLEVSPDLAVQLIVDRVLTPSLFTNLKEAAPAGKKRDKFGRRNIIELDLSREKMVRSGRRG